jgi:hypothetical protein
MLSSLQSDASEMSNSFSSVKASNITHCGAQKWHAKMYEKLGWTALGQSNGYKFKPKMYLHKIDILIESIKLKQTKTINTDRKNDLDIVLSNTRKLKEFANKLFDDAILKEADTEPGIATRTTMKWLSKWHAKMYKKLGWMALKKSQGKKYKVRCYLRTINDLIASAKLKISELTDPDLIDDAKIILNNSTKLRHFAEKLLL